MPNSYTQHLGLLKPDMGETMTPADFTRFFQTDRDTLDARIAALESRVMTAVTVSGDELTVVIENAATHLNLPVFLADLPEGTPVRITNFTLTLDSVAALTAFYSTLDTLNGLDANGNGLDKAQTHGTIRLIGSGETITVTGARLSEWTRQYPYITVIPQRIENHVYYYSYDGAELLRDEAVYDNGAAAYGAVPLRASAESGWMYSFRGWATSANASIADAVLMNIRENHTVYAAYERVQDIAPTLTMTAYSDAVGTPATADVTSWGAYRKITSLSALNASGDTITLSPGNGTLSVSESDNVTTVSVTPDSALFNGAGWRLIFADLYGSCTRSVWFNIRNIPILTVRKTSSGVGDDAVLDAHSRGGYPALVSYTFMRQGQFVGAANGNFTLTPGDGLTESGDVITITPPSAYNTNSGASVTASYLTFSNVNGDTVNIPVNIFG